MILWEIIKSAFITLKASKMRSFLTMLGIIIGISSVMSMWAIGRGGQEGITGDLKKNGYGKFTLTVDTNNDKFRYKYLFSLSTVKELEETGMFKGVSAQVEDFFGIKVQNEKERIILNMSTPQFEKMDSVDFVAGRNFLSFEYSPKEYVATIDNLTAETLFGSVEKALGNAIEISKKRQGVNIPYRIVGVFRNPLENFIRVLKTPFYPHFARIPYQNYNHVFDSGTGVFSELILEAKNPENMAESMDFAKKYLEQKNEIQDIYTTQTVASNTESFDKILSTLNIFVTFASAISLFVGGIGVMNIMLVTVVERTKEIGIRKSLGATNRDILVQFLIEAIILTVMGGIIGLIVGFLISFGAGKLLKIKPVYSFTAILVSLSVSIAIGVIFGVSPARKAAKLNPIDALRTE